MRSFDDSGIYTFAENMKFCLKCINSISNFLSYLITVYVWIDKSNKKTFNIARKLFIC